ncbi:MAG TPA: tripartite tricarboxylate transporter substrate binding protein [Xanthobacteraceae bacterium]|nr:tripartite tricarboxylate transporter substrate binding protein [Xanthobacteraceae bacterium]
MKLAAAAVSLALGLMGAAAAHAQSDFPSRPITLVVTQAAGGGMDAIARFVGRKLSDTLGQSVVIENRPGGAENVAISSVAKANPDGYTVLICSNSITINPSLYKNIPYDAKKDLRPIGRVGSSPLLIVTQASEPYRDLKEMAAFAKANPTKLSYGSPGTGTAHHMSMELIKSATGAPIQHIPYRGAAPGMNDLLAGVIPLYVASAQAAEPHIKTGKVRALVTISKARLPQLGDVPTLGEALPGVEVESWMAMFAPAATPDAAANKLSDALKTVLNDPEVAAQMQRLGTIPRWLSPAELKETMAKDEARWAAVIKEAGIKVD